MTSRTGSARRILGFLKSMFESWEPTSGEDGWLSLARGGLGQVSHEIEGRWKSQNRKNVYLSSYVEEPLNSKVIKSFVPEQRSRYVFFEFRDSYVLYSIFIDIQCTFLTEWLWYLISYLINHPRKESETCWTLLGKYRRTHKQHSIMDFYTWTHHC